MFWDVWETVFLDDTADMSRYDYYGLSGPQVHENVLYVGFADGFYQIGDQILFPENYLRPKLSKYRDVDVTVTVQITKTLKTNGVDEDTSHWFGIALRTARIGFRDAYLFYIRKNGNVEFGPRDKYKSVPPPKPEVASQPVTIRVKAEGDHVETWVNQRAYHNWRDTDKEFIRPGYIDLVTYSALVQITKVEVKVKKWYAPLARFLRRSWKVLVALGVIGSALGLFEIISRLLAK